ncbi:MAG: tail fiber domain-containing protein [Bacteroidota bacterium]
MRLLNILFLSCFFISLSQAQLSTSLLPDRLNFNDNNNAEGVLQFDGTNLFLDNNDRNGDLLLQSNNTLKLDGIDDVIVLGREELYLATGAGLGITRLFINDIGRVGIGTTNPSARLEVRGEASIGIPNFEIQDLGSDAAGARMYFRDSNNPSRYAGISANPGAADPTMRFSYNNQGTTMTLDLDDREVGIGIADPAATLHIDTNADDAMLVGDSGGALAWMTVNKPTAANDAITRFRDDGTTIMRVNPSSFTYEVDINGAGRITSGTWSASDKRLKQNIRNYKNALSDIQKLRPTTYQFDTKSSKYSYLNLADELQFGLIAQEVAEVFPNLVRQSEEVDEDGKPRGFDLYAVNYTALIPVLIAGIQEQQAIIENNETESQQLQTKVDELEDRLAALEAVLMESRNSEMINALPQKTTLQQNQPNPTQDVTTIAYKIPMGVQSAMLNITNQYGQVVKQITINERGQGQLEFSVNSLADGSYFYTLVLDGQVSETKQMMVAK